MIKASLRSFHAGGWSEFSDPVCTTTLGPPRVWGAEASAISATSVRIWWDMEGVNLDKARIESCTSGCGTESNWSLLQEKAIFPSSQEPHYDRQKKKMKWTMTGLTAEETRSYRVSIYNGGWSEPSNVVTATTPAAGSQPSSFKTSRVTETSVDLSWNPSGSSGLGQHVQKYGDGGSEGSGIVGRSTVGRSTVGRSIVGESSEPSGGSDWETVATLSGSASSYTVNGLSPGAHYRFRVVNIETDGDMVPSAPLDVKTQGDAPGMPTNVAATAGDGSATLTWTAPSYSGTITGWEYRTGETESRGYFAWNDWTAVEGGTAATTSHAVTGLVNGEAYKFQVRALAGDAKGAESASAAVTLPVRATGVAKPQADGDLRLADGRSDNNGRLEVFYNGAWGGVCDDHFKSTGAPVACKQMGYDGGSRDMTRRPLPAGMDFLLDDTKCTGSEATLAACPHRGWGVHNCSAREAVSVTCTGTPVAKAGTGTDMGLTGTATDRTATLSWTIPDNRQIEEVDVESLDSAGAVVSMLGTGAVAIKHLGKVREQIVSDLSAGTTYRFRVRLTMADDSHEYSGILSLTTQTEMSHAPADLEAEEEADGVHLSWTIPEQPAWVTEINYVQVTREMIWPLTAAMADIGTVEWKLGQTAYSFVDPDVVPGRTYLYQVEAYIGGVLHQTKKVKMEVEADAWADDPDSVPGGATVLDVAQATRGVYYLNGRGIDSEQGDTVDYYKFTLTSRKVVGLGVRGQRIDLDVYLEDDDENVLMQSWPPPVDATVEWLKMTLDPGTYYVRVEAPWTTFSDPYFDEEILLPPTGAVTSYYVRFGLTDPALTLSVADASAQEDSGSLVFTVSLDSAATRTLTVDYFTEDGTAVAVDDYSPRVGRLTFSPGDRTKTITVPIVNDSIDEGSETMILRLTNPQGASISDGMATGTINNSDPLQKMWLSRFGHMVGSQIVDEVSDRLARPLEGAQVTVGGQTLDLARIGDAQALTGLAQAFGEGGGVPLVGTSFHIAFGGESGDPAMVSWGRVASLASTAERDYRAGSLRLDNEVVTGIMGFDAQWSHGIAGVALSLSEGRSSFAQQGVDAGTVEASLTTATPYAQLRLGEGFHVWGLAGFGTGDMAIRQDRSDRVTRTDIEMQLSAVGMRGDLVRTDSLDLALKADAFMVQMASARAANTVATEAETSRMRVMLEASRRFALGRDAALVPGLELGLRQDGGDTESGAGVEIGASLAWAHPASNMEARLNARSFMGQGDSDYEEWGVSGALHIGGDAAGRGFLMSMTPTLGAADGDADRLWAASDASRLAAEGGFEAEGRFDAELGFGMPAFTRLTGTPYAGLGLSEGGRDWRLGWRLTPGSLPLDFSLGVEVTLTEPANDSEPEHGAMLRGGVRW